MTEPASAPQGYVRYRHPHPPMRDPGTDPDLCLALAPMHPGFGCTRTEGHQGRHEAGGFRGFMYASWPQGEDES